LCPFWCRDGKFGRPETGKPPAIPPTTPPQYVPCPCDPMSPPSNPAIPSTIRPQCAPRTLYRMRPPSTSCDPTDNPPSMRTISMTAHAATKHLLRSHRQPPLIAYHLHESPCGHQAPPAIPPTTPTHYVPSPWEPMGPPSNPAIPPTTRPQSVPCPCEPMSPLCALPKPPCPRKFP